MKISFVVPFAYPPFRGGIEYETYYISRGLAKKGHRVYVITSKPIGGGSAQEEIIDGVTYHRIPCFVVFSRLEFLLYLPSKVMQAVKNADVIYVKGLMSTFSLALSLYTAFLRKTLIIHVHKEKGASRGASRRILITALESMSKFVLKRASLLQGETDLDISYWKRKGTDRIQTLIIPPGLPSMFFDHSDYSAEGRRLLKASEEQRILLYVGRISPLKGPQIALESFAYLVRDSRFDDLLFVIAGSETPYVKLLVKRAKELNISKRVRILLNVSEREKLSLYDASTIVAIPSLFDYVEAFCLTLSEAWARRKAVVASRVGALKTRIVDGVDGVLVNPRSAASLAREIRSLLDDENLRLLISRTGRDNVHAWGEVIDSMEAMFRRTALERGNAR